MVTAFTSPVGLSKDMKVLIIEDDPGTAETLSQLLESRWPDIETLVTPSGREGLRLADAEQPDAIILDLGLPDIDGMDVLKEMRKSSDVPVIIVTARGQQRDRNRGLEEGATDYITKPYDPPELLLRVEHVVGELRLRREVERQNRALELRLRELTSLNSLFRRQMNEQLAVADTYRYLLRGLERLGQEFSALLEEARAQPLPSPGELSDLEQGEGDEPRA